MRLSLMDCIAVQLKETGMTENQIYSLFKAVGERYYSQPDHPMAGRAAKAGLRDAARNRAEVSLARPEITVVPRNRKPPKPMA